MVLVSANGLNYGKQYGQRAIFVIDVECDVLEIQIAMSSIFETRQSVYLLVTLREVISLAFATLLTYSSSSADKFSAAIRILTLREKCDRGV